MVEGLPLVHDLFESSTRFVECDRGCFRDCIPIQAVPHESSLGISRLGGHVKSGRSSRVETLSFGIPDGCVDSVQRFPQTVELVFYRLSECERR